MKGSFKNGTFPSLTGVIRFLIVTIQEDEFAEKFPSLTGVIHFLIECSSNYNGI